MNILTNLVISTNLQNGKKDLSLKVRGKFP